MTNSFSKLDLSFLPDPIAEFIQRDAHSAIITLVGAGVAYYVLKWIYEYSSVRWDARGLPGIHSAIEIMEAGHRSALPHIPGLIPSRKFTLQEPWKKYDNAKSDLIACTQASTNYPVYITADPHLAATAHAKSTLFLKPTKMFRYVAIDIFGRQIVSTQNGAEHRRHKSVVKGCFNETIMRGVWDAMLEKQSLMWSELGLEDGGVWEDIERSTVQIGFGQKWPWKIAETDSKILPLDESLFVVTHTMFPQLVAPLWLLKYNPFASVRRLATAQTSLIHHIKTMIKNRGDEIRAEQDSLSGGEKIKPPSDVLGALVASQMDIEAEAKLKSGDAEVKAGLTPEEVIGNVWIFIVAGHETSAHVIGFTLAYLALYPEHQEMILKEIDEITGGSLPTYRDMSALKYTLACVHEAVRLRDIVMTLPKVLAEDQVVPYHTWNAAGEVTTYERLLKKGAHLIIDSPACQLNPYVWSDPHVFRPTRMFDEQQKGLSTGFSAGQRACIGKRFAEVEIVAFLTHMIKAYKFEPIAKSGESREELEKRYLVGNEVLNLTPGKWDLKLTKRA